MLFLFHILAFLSLVLKDNCLCFNMVGFYHLEGGVRCRAAEGSIIGKHPGAAVFSVGKIFLFFNGFEKFMTQEQISSVGKKYQHFQFF